MSKYRRRRCLLLDRRRHAHMRALMTACLKYRARARDHSNLLHHFVNQSSYFTLVVLVNSSLILCFAIPSFRIDDDFSAVMKLRALGCSYNYVDII